MIITSNIYSKDHKHDLCVCAIFHNEARFLDEWIEHYVQEGVDRIYLYNNKSDDNYMRVLYKYIKAGIVVFRQWPYENEDPYGWNNTQCKAYLDCVERIKGKCEWCIFVDTDEFMFSPTGRRLKEVIQDYESYEQVGACWVFYGTSNVETLAPGAWLKDNMVWRTREINITVKSIVRPDRVLDCVNPHFFIMQDPSRTVNENKELMSGPFTTPSANILRINHYWPRDLEFFYSEKLRRRKAWVNDDIQNVIDIEKTMNEVYDPILKDKGVFLSNASGR